VGAVRNSRIGRGCPEPRAVGAYGPLLPWSRRSLRTDGSGPNADECWLALAGFHTTRTSWPILRDRGLDIVPLSVRRAGRRGPLDPATTNPGPRRLCTRAATCQHHIGEERRAPAEPVAAVARAIERIKVLTEARKSHELYRAGHEFVFNQIGPRQ